MQKPKPVNMVMESLNKPAPEIGTEIAVPPAHLFNLRSTIPCVRILEVNPGVWWTADPLEKRGLIVFITKTLTFNPKRIVITEVRDNSVAFAEEIPSSKPDVERVG